MVVRPSGKVGLMNKRSGMVAGSVLVLGGGMLWAALAAAPAAPAAPEDAVAAQVKSGLAVYAKSCQGCHGDKLQGNRAPALVGAGMLGKYAGGDHTYADLHTKVSKTMPKNAPGTLSEQQYLDVVALLFERNGVALPAGGLKKDDLKEAALSARAAQVAAGQAVYAKSCQGCHGDKLQGNRAPTLIGAAFVAKYKTVGALHAKVKTMPKNAPGSLTDRQYVDVLAFVLDRNEVAGGTASIGVDDFEKPLK